MQHFKCWEERQPWWKLPSCGWHCELRPGCPCISAWCVASAYSPVSPLHDRTMQKNAGSWRAGPEKPKRRDLGAGKGLKKRRLDWNTTYFDFSALYEIMSHWLHQRFKEVPWVLQHRDGVNERRDKNVPKKRAGMWQSWAQTESLASDYIYILQYKKSHENSTNPVKNIQIES